jgi:hypothetical protein
MAVELAEAIVTGLGVYAAVGLAFALAFVFVGARRLDPMARDGTWGFRLLILPGAAALWPMLLRRWIRGGPPPAERDAHRRASRDGAAR